MSDHLDVNGVDAVTQQRNKSVDQHGLPIHAPLGQQTSYTSEYDPSLLCPIARAQSRQSLSIEVDALPFLGVDLWTGYELSWLNNKGKPCVAVAEFSFPCDSASIVESKSFKLYLNSFNQTVFNSMAEVKARLKRDLSAVAGADIALCLTALEDADWAALGVLVGACIDDLDVEIDCYHPQSDYLCLEASAAHSALADSVSNRLVLNHSASSHLTSNQARVLTSESLYSNLLKSNCPVTGQPDWASLHIQYEGDKICREGLLKYIVSFRQHQDFHEHCVERIFIDIMARCQPQKLTVFARYTRRGGLDINPLRSTEQGPWMQGRLIRQ